MAYVAAFFIVEAASPDSGYWVTDLPIDAKIPFIPQFVFFYVLWYPLFAAVGLPTLIKDEGAFKRWIYYLIITMSATLLFDVLVPNGQHLRPVNMEVTSLSTWILSRLWMADTCTNVFPSMHVLGCLGDIAAVFDSKVFSRGWKWAITLAAVLCSVSTVLVKQHAFIDTAGAVAFAVPVLLLVYRRRIFRRGKETPQ